MGSLSLVEAVRGGDEVSVEEGGTSTIILSFSTRLIPDPKLGWSGLGDGYVPAWLHAKLLMDAPIFLEACR